MGSVSETVCVTGASGFVGSWLVKILIEQGYTVRATVRDPENMKKVKHLLDIPEAKTKLSLWKADLTEEGSYDEAINGCSGVFHVATPVDFQSKDPQNEVIKPAINGVLDIMKSCLKAKTVRRLIFTSSGSAVVVSKDRKLLFDETCWTDVDFCQTVKMNGWMYFVSKTLAEKEAWKFAKEHNIDLITIIPPLVTGPFIMPTIPDSINIALSPITGNEALFPLIKQCSFVHVDDLCRAHIFVFENPQAHGRYICSACSANIHQLSQFLTQKFPQYNVPTKFKNIPDELDSAVTFSSKKITDLGFQFKYNLEDMYKETIQTCTKKELLPALETQEN